MFQVDLSPLILPVAPWNISYCLHQTASPSRHGDQMMPLGFDQLLRPFGLYPKRLLCPFPGKFQTGESQASTTSKHPCFPFHPYYLSLQLLDTPFFVPISTPPPTASPETTAHNSASSRLLQCKDHFFSVQLQVSSLFLHVFSLYKKIDPTPRLWLSSTKPVIKFCKYT